MDETLPLANALRDIAWLLPRTLAREPSPAGLLPRSELEVMRLVVRRPGVSVNDAAAELGIAPSNVSAAVSSLVDKGQLERRSEPPDRRVVRLHATAEAQRSRADQEAAWSDALGRILGALDPDQAQQLLSASGALTALAEALSQDAGESGETTPKPASDEASPRR